MDATAGTDPYPSTLGMVVKTQTRWERGMLMWGSADPLPTYETWIDRNSKCLEGREKPCSSFQVLQDKEFLNALERLVCP